MRSYNKTKDLLNPILNILKTNPNLDKSSIISKLAEYFNLDNELIGKIYEKTLESFKMVTLASGDEFIASKKRFEVVCQKV